MKANVKDILIKQADWQQSRKAASWGDKIRQAESARDSLGSYAYRASGTRLDVWAEGDLEKAEMGSRERD